MARGWESKSVEAQIDMAQTLSAAAAKTVPDPLQLQITRKRESLLLSRIRVVRDMEAARNPRYKELLTKALADLDSELSELGG
jgi:hypothetical protein